MPQDIDFELPFSAAVSPDAESAGTRSLLWARERALVTNTVDEQRFLRWDIAGLMARWVPEAAGTGLDLAVNAVVVATLLDDQFDGELADRPEQIAALCADFATVTHGCTLPAATAGPLARSFAEVWALLCAGASDAWRERTAEHWRWYLDAYPEEARHRARREVPTVAEHFALRRRSGFVYAMIDLSEKSRGFESSPRVRESAGIPRMLDITADVVDTLNDVHSLEKEESRGDVHNLVLVIEKEQGCSRGRSLRLVHEMISAWCAEFLDLESRALSAGRTHALSGAEETQVRQLAACMRSAMRGYLDWSRTCLRYSRLIPPNEPAYAANLF